MKKNVNVNPMMVDMKKLFVRIPCHRNVLDREILLPYCRRYNGSADAVSRKMNAPTSIDPSTAMIICHVMNLGKLVVVS